jgi:hypothetical protein
MNSTASETRTQDPSTRTPERRHETLKERLQRQVREIESGRGTRAEARVPDAWQEKAMAAARTAADREKARQELTRYPRQMEIREQFRQAMERPQVRAQGRGR